MRHACPLRAATAQPPSLAAPTSSWPQLLPPPTRSKAFSVSMAHATPFQPTQMATGAVRILSQSTLSPWRTRSGRQPCPRSCDLLGRQPQRSRTNSFTPQLSDTRRATQRSLPECWYCGNDPNRLLQCHGTWARTGGFIEVAALSPCLSKLGVHIGSVKVNLSHAEGAVGLVSVLKAVPS